MNSEPLALVEIAVNEMLQESDSPQSHLLAAMMVESDRGCVLVACAIIDQALTDLFLAVFLQSKPELSKGDLDDLLTGRRPLLESTTLKSALAMALGLIPKRFHQVIDAMNKLRSQQFAHTMKPRRLTLDDVRKVQQVLPPKLRQMHESTTAQLMKQGGTRERLTKPKTQFCVVAMSVLTEIEQQTEKLQSSHGS